MSSDLILVSVTPINLKEWFSDCKKVSKSLSRELMFKWRKDKALLSKFLELKEEISKYSQLLSTWFRALRLHLIHDQGSASSELISSSKSDWLRWLHSGWTQ